MKRPLGYGDGIATAFALIGLAVAMWLASKSIGLEQIYREMNPKAVLPASTQIVFSMPWRIGVPLALVSATVAAYVWRPRYAFAAIALVAIGIDIFWYMAAWKPIFDVAGNIR